MSSSALSFRGAEHGYPIRFGFARSSVLRGVDLDVARGATLGLAGPNGSGKSTLLRLAAGIDAPTRGSVTVLGGSAGDPAIRERVGYLPEEAAFPRELTCRGALRLFGALAGMPRRDAHRRSDELLAIVGLAGDATRTLSRCSRGMLRRFGLAQAWLSAPDLILLDEPTAGLDALGFDVLTELLNEARARHAAVVLASHVLSDLSERCDDVAILCEGRIVQHGTPSAVLAGTTLMEIYRRHAGARRS
ncbi:MAG: ABC transporter ATP-binding protein [Planctomycetota bacterium]|nr:ABC transporter ATP-binding protein [Planctomycetota bacterium]